MNVSSHNTMTISGHIIVKKDIQMCFDFFANPKHDTEWRTEINEIDLDGPFQLGVHFTEFSYLSKKLPHHPLEFHCIALEPNRSVVFETILNSKYYQKSTRNLIPISDKVTQINYTSEFDLDMVKHAIGFRLPHLIIRIKAQKDLNAYLNRLKAILEKKSS